MVLQRKMLSKAHGEYKFAEQSLSLIGNYKNILYICTC